MSKFLHSDDNGDDENDDAKATAIPEVFSEHIRAKINIESVL